MSSESAKLEQMRAQLADRWWRLNNLYYIVDKWGNKKKFSPNQVQADLDDNLWYLNIVLKSRQHGVTTWACIRALDMALFRPNSRCGIVAHKREDAETFFRTKVLFAYDNLPDWLKRARPAVRRDLKDGILEFANGSSVNVSLSHRGGTLQFLHISEYGPMCSMYPERAKEVASGALNTVAVPKEGELPNIVVIESTAYGADGDFYDRTKAAMDLAKIIRAGRATLSPMDYKFHFYGWYDDILSTTDPRDVIIPPETATKFEKLEESLDRPIKAGQRAWYVKKSAEQREHMAREYPSDPEEAFRASVDGAYYGKHMELADKEGRIGNYPWRPGAAVHTFWDIGRRDATAIWFMQENGGWWDLIRYFEETGEQAAFYARKLQEFAINHGYAYGKHYMPHDIEVIDWVGTGDNRPRKAILEELGVKPIVVVPRIHNEQEGIDMTRRVFHRLRFDIVNCGPPSANDKTRRGGIEAIRNFRRQYNEKTESFSESPRPDWTNHGADALRQLAQAFNPDRPARSGEKTATDSGNWKSTT